MAWLETQGVRFNASACPYKTSYPVNKYYLYYSGNEIFSPYKEAAKPAPRGHRAYGEGGGMAGTHLFNPLRDSAIRKGAKLHRQCRLHSIIQDDTGRVIGAELRQIASPWKRWLHSKLCDLEVGLRYLIIGAPGFSKLFQMLFALLEKGSKPVRIRAKRGVLIATGGFAFNPKMLKQYAPKYARGTPLGRCSDDGSGIRIAQQMGASTEHMQRISAWRFINPPKAFCRGLLVGKDGKRICNEAMYGSHVGEFMTENHGGHAWLIVTPEILKQAKLDLKPEYAQWFQSLPMRMNFLFNSKHGKTIDQLAKRAGIDADKLSVTLAIYNGMAANQEQDPLNKPLEFIEVLEGPFMAIDCSLHSRKFACPIVTFGGLKLNEDSGEVLHDNGQEIPGLYAAGRSAAGLSSGRYVSGLSISDCVFAGRRAAQHISQQPKFG